MTPRKKRHHEERHIRVRAVQNDNPDLKKFASAVIALAQAQAEAEAQAEHDRRSKQNGEPDDGKRESA
jgi:hypothetical protein